MYNWEEWAFLFVLEWHVSYISIKFIWSNMSFKASVSLLIFCLNDLSIDVSGALHFPTILLWYCQYLPLCLLIFALCIWCSYVGSIYIYSCYIFLLDQSLYLYIMSFISCCSLCFTVYFVWYKYSHSSFLLVFICTECLFPHPSLSVCICLYIWSGSLVSSIYMALVFVFIQPLYVFWLQHLVHLHVK